MLEDLRDSAPAHPATGAFAISAAVAALLARLDAGRVAAVEAAVRAAVARAVLPRFRHLADSEVSAKSGPHDLVTVADREAEQLLTASLPPLLPGSVVVGEEAVAEDPARYEALRAAAPVWIIDPVDGTRQFVRGEAGFCTLVALAVDGVVVASWTYAPVLGLMAVAVRGRGAVFNGESLPRPAATPGGPLTVACSHPDYTTGPQQAQLRRLAVHGLAPRPCGSAGLEYLAIARGALDATAFSWELAWDHAAGLLLVEETGGAHLTTDGLPFRITGGNALAFTTARDAATAERVRALLAGETGADGT
ncbi:inositol monophosphatase family protein [Streptomyces sp. SPB074]|uniref:inositol monophosphatase family protein n=1 Tax=Streptomyces sp. (strain SPB074) TaxID=465543 RepID=UPI00017F10AC|nr:inositol monophosphatase family protein [Streptomyces sp. SPB074]EDY45063.2 inositol monophosphatase [Streptomyces sp. SPB074]